MEPALLFNIFSTILVGILCISFLSGKDKEKKLGKFFAVILVIISLPLLLRIGYRVSPAFKAEIIKTYEKNKFRSLKNSNNLPAELKFYGNNFKEFSNDQSLEVEFSKTYSRSRKKELNKWKRQSIKKLFPSWPNWIGSIPFLLFIISYFYTIVEESEPTVGDDWF